MHKDEKKIALRHEIIEPLARSPGVELTIAGIKMMMRPPVIPDPYIRFGVYIEGLSPIVGPSAPNLDVYLALLAARLKAGKLSQEAYDRMLEEVRGKQVERMKSDQNGDASGEIAKEIVEANINTFPRDSTGAIVLQSYSFRACLRECLSESGYFMENAGSRERFKNGLGIWPLAVRIERDDRPLLQADDIHIEYVAEGDKIATQPVHVWAQNKMQHSISQFEVIEPPWRARVLVEVRRNLLEGFEGSPAEAEADGEGPEAKATASEKDTKAKKEGKKERKVRMAPISPEAIAQALGLGPTIAWGAKRSMGYGRFRVVGVSDPILVESGQPYPFDWKSIRGL